MQYRKDKYGNELSVLGFGCMRLPRSISGIDLKKSEELLMQAYNSGVNYFDTAYIYPGSEEALGTILERTGIRDKINIATKLPHQRVKSISDAENLFQTELKRLKTSRVDYYLIHNMVALDDWQRMEKIDLPKWISEKKASGQIRQLGFSFHGTFPEFEKLINVYDWDFVQIQYNYLNEHFQAGIEGLKMAASKNIPVIIMEPLLGGKLANPPSEVCEEIKKHEPDSTPVSVALNWLWSQSEVTLILSGMNEENQVKENLMLADSSSVKNESERDKENELIEKIRALFDKYYKIKCTGCNYCMPCPKGINIPGCFNVYNNSYVSGLFKGLTQYATTVGALSKKSAFASDCVKCGACEKKCPQKLPIRDNLVKVKNRFELPGVGLLKNILRKM